MNDVNKILASLSNWLKAHPRIITLLAIIVSIGGTYLFGKKIGAFIYYIQMNYFN